MLLNIKVRTFKGQPPENAVSINFDVEGGVIGRSKSNRLVLHDVDKYISRAHATVYYENGAYYLKDTSMAGTLLMNHNKKLHGDSAPLAAGDMIRIGDYELVVDYCKSESAASSPFDTGDGESGLPFIEIDRFDGSEKAFKISPQIIETEEQASQSMDIAAHAPRPGAPYPLEDSPHHDHFIPPDIKTDIITSDNAAPKFPTHYNFENLLDGADNDEVPIAGPSGTKIYEGINALQSQNTDLKNKEPPPLNPEKTPSPVRIKEKRPEPLPPADTPDLDDAHKQLFDIFIDALGIHDDHVLGHENAPEIIQTTGILFREIVSGLITVLRGRSEMKSDFRVAATILRSNDNNPLKFSPSVNDALRALLGRSHSGFTDPVAAVRECFMDIMNHQMAMNAGIQASVMNLLKQFNPDNFEQHMSEGIVFHKKAKCWDLYCRSYRQLTEDAMDNIFGEAFSRAYETQIQRLADSSPINRNGKT